MVFARFTAGKRPQGRRISFNVEDGDAIHVKDKPSPAVSRRRNPGELTQITRCGLSRGHGSVQRQGSRTPTREAIAPIVNGS